MTTAVSNDFECAVANYIANQMFPPHRGVIEVKSPFGDRPLVVLFGNDDYGNDDRTKRYADRLLAQYCGWGFNARFGVCTEVYTWVIVIRDRGDEHGCPRLNVFEDDLYLAYRQARGLASDDGMMFAMASIHKRELIEHTSGNPVVIPGWEAVN
jgi:hypothetical protein